MSSAGNEDEILKELQHISKLLVEIATKDQIQKEKIRILSAAGFAPKEIAALVDTTGSTVRVALSTMRKKAKKAKKKSNRRR